MRYLLCAALLAMAANAYAQDNPASVVDQSLLPSEPVEESPDLPEAPTPAALPTIPSLPEKQDPMVEGDTAVLQGLKKVTTETSSFDVPLDTPANFGTLTITVKKCMMSAPGTKPENSALILIEDNHPGEPAATVFSGWMFSSSPALSALEHPVYDITVLECAIRKKPEPVKPAEKPAAKTKKSQR